MEQDWADSKMWYGYNGKDPDYYLIGKLMEKIFNLKERDMADRTSLGQKPDNQLWYDYKMACRLFRTPHLSDDEKFESIMAIEKIAPGAYEYGKKPSRIYRSICDAIGVSDETRGSRFQRLFARVADELCVRNMHIVHPSEDISWKIRYEKWKADMRIKEQARGDLMKRLKWLLDDHLDCYETSLVCNDQTWMTDKEIDEAVAWERELCRSLLSDIRSALLGYRG